MAAGALILAFSARPAPPAPPALPDPPDLAGLFRRRFQAAEAPLCAADPFLPLLVGDRLLERVELHVRDGDEEQREEQAERLAADDGDRDRRAALAADAEAERGGDQARDDRRGR